MDDARKRKNQVIGLIAEAFRGVELGAGVSLHETEVIDRYGSPEERQAARARDETHDWFRLIDDPALTEVTGIGGPSFMDAEGLRFYLPAYMVRAMHGPWEDVDRRVMFQITHLNAYGRERLSILTPEQRRAVRAFLLYIRDHGGEDLCREPELTQAIDGYWSL